MPTPQTGPEVVVGNHRLTSIAPGWGDLKIVDRWGTGGGGNWEMTWTVPVNRLRRHRALVAGAPVRCYLGPYRRWSGHLSEPNWDTGEMVALGNVRRGAQALALDETEQLTSIADTAVRQAIGRGALPWVFRGSISTVALADMDTSGLNYVDAVVDAATLEAGTSWGVNARDELYALAPPTEPTLLVTPDSGVLGTADTTLAKTIIGRYQPWLGGPLMNVTVGAGAPEVGVSLLPYGPMTPERATEVITSILAAVQPRTAWTNGIELTAPQVTNRGGCRTNLGFIQANGRQMARLQGVRDVRGLDAGTNFVLGETIWDVADQTVQANPVGMIAHDLGSIIEDAGGELLALS